MRRRLLSTCLLSAAAVVSLLLLTGEPSTRATEPSSASSLLLLFAKMGTRAPPPPPPPSPPPPPPPPPPLVEYPVPVAFGDELAQHWQPRSARECYMYPPVAALSSPDARAVLAALCTSTNEVWIERIASAWRRARGTLAGARAVSLAEQAVDVLRGQRPSRARVPSIGIVTSMTADRIGDYDLASLSKLCYVAQHGFAFILDLGPLPADVELNPWWRKVDTVPLYLPLFDWLLWMDGDTVAVNRTVPLDWLLAPDVEREAWRRESLDIVITDHNENINDGVVAFRRSPWTVQLLAEWRATGVAVHANGSRFAWDPQGALWHMFCVLGSRSPTRDAPGPLYRGQCAVHGVCNDMGPLLDCYNASLYAAGHRYRARRVEHVRFLDAAVYHVPLHPERGWIRGAFDQYLRVDLPDWVVFKWAPENFFVPGDFVLHMGENKWQAGQHLLEPHDTCGHSPEQTGLLAESPQEHKEQAAEAQLSGNA